MLVSRMRDAWKARQDDAAQAPSTPAGASPLDELYLDGIVGGSADRVDSFSLGCSSSVPSTITSCPTSSNCTA